ncbi:outer membrane protein assembly factor BamC [Agaribacter flavus]|uniref:Outer membrane protein assembly factor BamC n=1 Tax=Agaribacter flavus TaxID=1902781 RepID=A0ABV7FRJ7_9ALTE
MKTINLLAVLVGSLCIGACSNIDERTTASGSVDYLEHKTVPPLKVPADLTAPPTNNRYAIPSLGSNDAPQLVGKALSVASPRLVIPLVSGSHVEEGSKQAKVLFDQINDNEPLEKTIWDTVLAYLELNNIGVDSFDKENNELITDWVIDRQEVDNGWLDFSSDYIERARKFKLSLELAPHGRTAALHSSMIKYIDENREDLIDSINPIAKRTDEVNFINYIIAEYDFGIRLERSERIAKIREGFSSEMGFNPDGEAAFLVDAEYADAWPRLQLVLRKMGFDVVDLDQSSGLLFVKYNGPEESWFSGWFSKDELSLDEDDYRLIVQKVGDKTSITFKDIENEAFTAQQVTEIFPTFSEYMAANDLDI